MKHLLALGGIVMGGALLIKEMWDSRGGGVHELSRKFVRSVTGWDYQNGSYNIRDANFGIPVLIGVGGSYVASKTGVNRLTPKGWNL